MNSSTFFSILATAVLLLPAGMAQPAGLAVGGDYSGMLERYLTRSAFKYLDEREAAVAALRSTGQLQARQERIRARLLEQIGGLPERKTPLNPKITGRFTRDGYLVENVIFESLPGFRVTANLYLPTSGKAPYPAVLGVAGHTRNGKASATYQHAWIGLVKRGYVVLAFDPVGQGERLEYFDPDLGRSKVGVGVPEHIMAGQQCLLTGGNIARYEVWDGVRALDYLITRKEVDPQKIAVAGNSGGGTQASYLAVFEPRLAAAVSSCYMTGWRELWAGQGPQDSEQVFAGFLREGFDFGDFFLAFAPKPFLMTAAIRDFFPIDGARKTYREALRLFELMGASSRAGYFEYDDGHGWSQPRREAAARWLDRYLQDRESDGREPPIVPEPESRLYATATGQLATSGGSETVQSLNLSLARELAARRPAATREKVLARLALTAPVRAPAAESKGRLDRPGYSIEKLELIVADNVRIPALLFNPVQPAGRKPAIVYANSAGKAAEADSGQDIEEFVRMGNLVLAVDPRGMGEALRGPGAGAYSALYRLAARGWLLDAPLAGVQVEDLLHAFQYLRSHAEADAERISIFAKGAAGPLALLAAALEPRIRKAAIEGSVLSYMDIVAARIHQNLSNLIVPGVLKDFDLPEVARWIAPRPLWVVSAVHPNLSPMLEAEARQRLPLAHVSWRIFERPEGSPASDVYAGWLK